MKGLLKKDFLLLQSYAKSLMLMLVFFLIIGVTSGPSFIVGIIMIECVTLAVSTFAYDDMAKWDTYMLALPVSRKTAVREKYVFALLLGLIGIALSLAASLFSGILRGNVDFANAAATIGGCLVAACLYVAVMLPLTYRFGSEKMRVMLIAVFVVLFALLFGGYVLLQKVAPGALETLVRMWPLLPILTVLALAVSYIISVRIFQKKEI